MTSLLKYDGFLPTTDDNPVSVLYRVNSSQEQNIVQVQCIVLLVDISGSMYRKMNDLIKAILSTVDIILSKEIATLDQIVLITFDSYPKTHLDFKDYDKFKETVMNLTASGNTNYALAIDELADLLREREQVIAVMFSDGEPNEQKYKISIENLTIIANEKSLLFHSIGLNVSYRAEEILRSLTTIGSSDGYYQSIEGAEIIDAMNVLVDHFYCSKETSINDIRTHNGFIVSSKIESLVHSGDRKVDFEVVNISFKEMLEKNSFKTILDAVHFLVEYYLRKTSLTCDQAITIAEHVSSLIRETEKRIRKNQKEKSLELCNEKKAKLDSIVERVGASNLKQQSEIVSEYNKKIQNVLKEDSELLTHIHELKELCAQIQETLQKNKNILASISGEVMNIVNQFRNNSIALKRKNMARLSSKVREGNARFQNIDQLLQNEIDHFVELECIDVPKYFENYLDPITLDNFQEIMLSKFGVFMLLVTVERHPYGIAAPHKTKIIEVGGFTSSVLEAMGNNTNGSILFDFRGIGSGNAAIPLWINDLHWKKARHLFGPFVGYAVTGNELEYTKLQGMTLLALILLHLRKLEITKFNEQSIKMVSQTLSAVIDKEKWKNTANDITNSFENINENAIPSIEVFLVFLEFSGVELPTDKALLLLAEQYRRKNVKHILNNYEKIKSCGNPTGHFLYRMFPKVFELYLNISNVFKSFHRESMEHYFLNVYNPRKDTGLLRWFDVFSQSLDSPLSKLVSNLDNKQKIAIILSANKCTCFGWDAIDTIPVGLNYDSKYPELLFDWCKKREKSEYSHSNENILLQILQTKEKIEAEILLRNIKRNSHTWGAMMKILLPSNKIPRPSKLFNEEWEKHRVKLYKELIESMMIPLHFELLMFSIFDSFNPEDWISSKMIWRPKFSNRCRIKAMFPEAPVIE